MTEANRQEVETQDGAPDRSAPRVMMNEAQVLKIVPVSRTTLYRMEKAGKFPRSTYISPNRRVWFEDEIIGWQSVRLTNSIRTVAGAKGVAKQHQTHNGVMSVQSIWDIVPRNGACRTADRHSRET